MQLYISEPPRDKTNKMAWAPSEDSDQPGHPPSLIRIFAVRMKKAIKIDKGSESNQVGEYVRSGFINEPWHDKTNKMSMRPAKTQISLGIRPVWSESSLCAQWVAKNPMFLHADSEDSDQTGRMPRLIWVFAWRTLACWFCHVAAQM